MQDGNNMVSGAVTTNNVGDQFPTNNVGDQFPTTQESKDRILDAFIGGEQSEICGNGKYLELYEQQNKVSKQLEERTETKDLRNIDGSKLYFSPDKLEFDGDAILYKPQILRDFPHLFICENDTFREVPLLTNKTKYSPDHKGDSVIPISIKKIKHGFYCVTLANCKDGKNSNRGRIGDAELGYPEESYIIDKEGNILEQFGKLGNIEDKDGIYLRHISENNWGFQQLIIEEYNKEGKKRSEKTIIFDDNMNELFTVDTENYSIQYCDNKVCVYQDRICPDKCFLVTNGTIEEIQDKDRIQGFIDFSKNSEATNKAQEEENKRLQSLPFGERFRKINHCIISLNEEEKTAIIQNDKGDKLYEITDVLAFYENDNRPEFKTKDGNLRIHERNKDLGVLCIYKYVGGYIKKSIFINKTTCKKLEFDGYEILQGRLIEVNGSEIYDENLNKLGMRIWSGDGVYAIARKEGKEIKRELYSTSTGKPLCEIGDKGLSTIKRSYEDENHKKHLIVEQNDGTLIEVVPYKE